MILKNELFKLFSKKTLWILTVILLAVNVLSLVFTGNDFGDENYGIPDSAFRRMQYDLSEIAAEERLSFIEEKIYEQEVYSALSSAEFVPEELLFSAFPILQEERARGYIANYSAGGAASPYTGDSYNEQRFLEKILGQMDAVYGYSDYLDGIQRQADQMSASAIFWNTDSFSRRNIEKTAAVYAKVKKQELPFCVTENIGFSLNAAVTDICAVLAALYAALVLICDERESGAFSLLRTLKNGRARLMLMKISALFIFCGGAAVLFTASSLMVGGVRFGFCELSIPIQSVSGFIGCTLDISLWQYLLLYCGGKAAACFVVSMIAFFVGTAAKNNIAVYAVTGGIVVLETVLYVSIDGLSVFSPLKYINVIALTRTNDIFGSYRNINIFDYPVSLGSLSIVLTLILMICLGFAAVTVYSGQKNTSYSIFRLSALLSRINPFGRRISVSLFRHETYKAFIANKGAVVLVVMLVLCRLMYTGFYTPHDETDGYFRQYVGEHGGRVTAETEEFVEAESLRFQQLDQESGLAAEIALRPRNGFEVFRERYTYAGENSAEIVYDTGYNLLFSAKTILQQLIFLFIFMSIISAPSFASDSKTMTLINSTSKGRKRDILVRGGVYGIITAVMFVISHLPILVRILQSYGADGINAGVKSVSALRYIPVNITLLEYMILHYAALLIIAFAVMTAMLWLSRRIKSVNGCMVLLLAIFALPCSAVWVLI